MIPIPRSRLKHAARITTLIVPTWLAWWVAFSAPHRETLPHFVALALGPLWIAMAGTVVVRAALIVFGKKTRWDQLDILTAQGSALACTSALAIMGAVWIGWASLAVIGLLGTAVFHVAVLRAFVALRGLDPMRAKTITRTFSPDIITEGDDVVEKITFTGTRVPIGFRLFMTGRVGPRWATCRHVLDAAEAGGEIALESEIGPAVRGEHDAEPLQVWLEDTFGLCRSIRVPAGEAKLSVLPRIRRVDNTLVLRDRGAGPRTPRPASILPTEGLFQLREYQFGDDVRRIHWVRSLAAGELIVRLPDEVPPDQPRVRLVLDTFFPEAFAFSCDAVNELLDTVVAVWLGIGRALAESGVRVTMVTALTQNEIVSRAHQDFSVRAAAAARKLAAKVSWQNRMTVNDLLADGDAIVVSRGIVVAPPDDAKVRWILVAPGISPELPCPFPTTAWHPFPMGAPDNRPSRRRRAMADFVRARGDHGRAILAMQANAAAAPPGSLVAMVPHGPGDPPLRFEVIQ
jgi:uncharacterized protein (DUF58 family)